MKRRELLKLALGGLSLRGGLPRRARPSAQALLVNGGINVQPVRRFEPDAGLTPPLIAPEIVEAQMRAVYQLGFEHMRITISFNRFGPDFLAAIPYVRAARALGIDVVGVIGQFTGFDLVQALTRPGTRDEVLECYARIFGDFVPAASPAIDRPGSFAAQILNEPTHFLGIAPDVYVREFLRPAYFHLKEDDPSMLVVSAAPIGSAEGLLRARMMVEAGLEHYCDRIALHIYSERFLEPLGRLTNAPVWVTETGVSGTSRHLEWLTNGYERIRALVPAVERLFWFDLFDFEPGAFRLFDLRHTVDGKLEAVVESAEAVALLEARLTDSDRDADADAERPPYEELVPDITLYFPTAEDERHIASTSFGAGV